MNQVLAQLFDEVPLKTELAEFTPADTTPWHRLEVDAFLEQEYRRSRADIVAGKAVGRVETAVGWLGRELGLAPGAGILDVGCGAGLYSHRLAERGYRVTGIDISTAFLTFARDRATAQAIPCRYRELSAFEMDYAEDFDLVLLTQGPSLQLTRQELAPFLARAGQALRPRGHLICEFSVAPADIPACAPKVTVSTSPPGRRLLGKPLLAQMLRKLTFAEARQRVNHRLFLSQDGALVEWWSRFFLHTRADVTAELERAGFEIRGCFGPVIGRPFVETDRTCHVWATLPDEAGGRA